MLSGTSCILQEVARQLVDFGEDNEIVREALPVSTHLLIQALGPNAVQLRQIRIEQHPLPTQHQNAVANSDRIVRASGRRH
jgi:hypothetical protein